MNKRIEKRHARHVLRAKQKVRLSEPDLRTPEQVRAAREASRSPAARHNEPHYAQPPVHRPAMPVVDSEVKVEP